MITLLGARHERAAQSAMAGTSPPSPGSREVIWQLELQRRESVAAAEKERAKAEELEQVLAAYDDFSTPAIRLRALQRWARDESVQSGQKGKRACTVIGHFALPSHCIL